MQCNTHRHMVYRPAGCLACAFAAEGIRGYEHPRWFVVRLDARTHNVLAP
jgi:hypothetical protein